MKLGKDNGDRRPAIGCAYATMALAALGVVLVLAVAWKAAAWVIGL